MMIEEEKKAYMKPAFIVTRYTIADVIATSSWGFEDEDDYDGPDY